MQYHKMFKKSWKVWLNDAHPHYLILKTTPYPSSMKTPSNYSRQ